MTIKSIIAGAAIAASLIAGAASAATVTYNSNVLPLASTNWANTLAFTQFNPALGTLTSVKVTLNGGIFGNARAESLDAAASVITLNLGSNITLTRPDGSTIVVVSPGISNAFNATAFDGSIDFGGLSGTAYNGVAASLSNSATLSSAADFGLFTGLGSLFAPITAFGTSNGSGSGNLITQFQTQAQAFGTVEYTFAAATVPEPASWAMLITGFGLVGAASRRRRMATAAA